MKILFLITIVMTSVANAEFDVVTVPRFRNYTSDSVYGDVMSRSKAIPFGDGLGRSTNIHETTHQINKFLRKKYAWKISSGRINGFYILNGQAVILAEPNIKKSDVKEYIPKILRNTSPGGNYKTYIEHPAWEEFPLYIFDEWVAYTNEGFGGIDDYRSGLYTEGRSIAIYNCLEFSIYAVALAMAVEEHDSYYWNNYPKFRKFLLWHMKRVWLLYEAGDKISDFRYNQDKLLDILRYHEDAKEMRTFIKQNLESEFLE